MKMTHKYRITLENGFKLPVCSTFNVIIQQPAIDYEMIFSFFQLLLSAFGIFLLFFFSVWERERDEKMRINHVWPNVNRCVSSACGLNIEHVNIVQLLLYMRQYIFFIWNYEIVYEVAAEINKWSSIKGWMLCHQFPNIWFTWLLLLLNKNVWIHWFQELMKFRFVAPPTHCTPCTKHLSDSILVWHLFFHFALDSHKRTSESRL